MNDVKKQNFVCLDKKLFEGFIMIIIETEKYIFFYMLWYLCNMSVLLLRRGLITQAIQTSHSNDYKWKYIQIGEPNHHQMEAHSHHTSFVKWLKSIILSSWCITYFYVYYTAYFMWIVILIYQLYFMTIVYSLSLHDTQRV